jgi:hypothetical protein
MVVTVKYHFKKPCLHYQKLKFQEMGISQLQETMVCQTTISFQGGFETVVTPN